MPASAKCAHVSACGVVASTTVPLMARSSAEMYECTFAVAGAVGGDGASYCLSSDDAAQRSMRLSPLWGGTAGLQFKTQIRLDAIWHLLPAPPPCPQPRPLPA